MNLVGIILEPRFTDSMAVAKMNLNLMAMEVFL